MSEAQVTAGYLARRESTSGGHWDTGGGGGKLRGGVTGRWVVADGGWWSSGKNRQWLWLREKNSGCPTINRNSMTRQEI